jgi:hypothetical protein
MVIHAVSFSFDRQYKDKCKITLVDSTILGCKLPEKERYKKRMPRKNRGKQKRKDELF